MEPREMIRSLVVSILLIQARLVLKKYRPTVVVVTGSVGKTSTKDAIFDALSPHLFVRKSEKGFNSEVGVPLTILGVPNGWRSVWRWLQNIFRGCVLLLVRVPYPQWLILEVSADRPGDISKQLSWIKPHIVVTTRFPDISVHVEFYDNPEDVIREELDPVSWLSEEGTVVTNADDENTEKHLPHAPTKRIQYGCAKHADVRALRYRITASRGVPTGISFDVEYGDEKLHVVKKGVVGRTHLYTTLAAVATALAAGIPFSNVRVNEDAHTPNGRLRIIPGAKGTIIDDSYNASPVAAEKALEALGAIKTNGKKIVVLADMMELGQYSSGEHTSVGKLVPEAANELVTIGVRAKNIAKGAREAGMSEEAIHVFEKQEDATAHLLSQLGEGDIVLIKGSQSMRLEHMVKALMKEPERADELLVRQEIEWLNR